MALPTGWELLISPITQFGTGVVIGVLLILLGLFKGVILEFIVKGINLITGSDIPENALAITLIGSGIIIVWFPSIVKELWSTTEGIIVLSSIVVSLILILIILARIYSNNKNSKQVF